MPSMPNNSILPIYFATVREFFLSIIIAYLICYVLPDPVWQELMHHLLSIFRNIPLTVTAFFVANLSTMVFIAFLGLIKKEFISFFVVLNGASMGTIAYLYRGSADRFMELLFPHAIFETILIVLYCSHMKDLSIAYSQKNKKKISYNLLMILLVCMPLLLVSALVEAQ